MRIVLPLVFAGIGTVISINADAQFRSALTREEAENLRKPVQHSKTFSLKLSQALKSVEYDPETTSQTAAYKLNDSLVIEEVFFTPNPDSTLVEMVVNTGWKWSAKRDSFCLKLEQDAYPFRKETNPFHPKDALTTEGKKVKSLYSHGRKPWLNMSDSSFYTQMHHYIIQEENQEARGIALVSMRSTSMQEMTTNLDGDKIWDYIHGRTNLSTTEKMAVIFNSFSKYSGITSNFGMVKTMTYPVTAETKVNSYRSPEELNLGLVTHLMVDKATKELLKHEDGKIRSYAQWFKNYQSSNFSE